MFIMKTIENVYTYFTKRKADILLLESKKIWELTL